MQQHAADRMQGMAALDKRERTDAIGGDALEAELGDVVQYQSGGVRLR